MGKSQDPNNLIHSQLSFSSSMEIVTVCRSRRCYCIRVRSFFTSPFGWKVIITIMITVRDVARNIKGATDCSPSHPIATSLIAAIGLWVIYCGGYCASSFAENNSSTKFIMRNIAWASKLSLQQRAYNHVDWLMNNEVICVTIR